MKLYKAFCTILTVVAISGCDNAPQQSVPTFQVAPQEFGIEISGFGEIEAAQAQKIVSPGRQPMTLAWLKDENTYVEKGDVIARFDAERIQRESREEELELLKIEQEIVSSIASQREQKQEVESDKSFVAFEFDFVERFAIDDLRIYSQLEIIDTLANKDFLEAKDGFLGWKETSIDDQHESQMAVLDIRKSGIDAQYQRLRQALTSLEVVSPYSGLLVYEKDRRGEKPSVGQTIFPGRAIAQIPNLDNMQAKIFVQANEAIELAEGQSVSITLDAYPERNFSGTLKNVAGFPRSIERGNPVTYFELTASIENQDKTIMQPGRKISATVKVKPASSKLVVPLQTLHHENGKTYVYLQQAADFIKQEVISGRKNLHLVEITSGLQAGDVIALSPPSISS